MEQQTNQQTSQQSNKEIIVFGIIVGVFILFLCVLGVYQYQSDINELKIFCQDNNMSYDTYADYKVCYGVIDNITYMVKIIRFKNGYGFAFPDFNYSG